MMKIDTPKVSGRRIFSSCSFTNNIVPLDPEGLMAGGGWMGYLCLLHSHRDDTFCFTLDTKSCCLC